MEAVLAFGEPYAESFLLEILKTDGAGRIDGRRLVDDDVEGPFLAQDVVQPRRVQDLLGRQESVSDEPEDVPDEVAENDEAHGQEVEEVDGQQDDG